MKKIFLALTLCVATLGMYAAATVFTDEQGVTYEYAGVAGKIISYTGAQPNVIIPSPVKYGKDEFVVTAIADNAFDSNTKLESIVLPGDLQTIGNYAFYKCTRLYKVEFTKGFNEETQKTDYLINLIGRSAFDQCTALIDVYIPVRIEGTGANETVKPKMDRYGALCYNFRSVPNIKVPSIVNASDSRFKYFPWGASRVNGITDGYLLYLEGDTEKTDLHLCSPAARGTVIIPSKTYKIRSRAFENCDNMTAVVIPASVTDVETRIFTGCKGLTSIVCKCTTPPVSPNYDDKSPEFEGVDKTIPVYVPEGTIDAYKKAKGWELFSNYQVLTAETEEELSKVTLTLSVNDATMGSVKGAGVYTSGQDVTIEAIPAEGYKFIQWSDNNSETPRTLKVTRSMELTAVFADKNATGQYILTLLVNDPNMGEVTGAGSYNEGEMAMIEATAKEGYVFKQWSDGNKLYRRSIMMTENLTLTAIFETNAPAGQTFTITATAKDPATGSVQGGGVYGENATINLLAVPNKGYDFAQWSDGDKSNPRTITVTADATYVAEFVPKPEGIESVQNSEVSVQKVIENGRLIIIREDGIYDAFGTRMK